MKMIRRRQILLSLGITAVLLLTSLTGVMLYYYYNPAKIKGLIEKALFTSTGTPFAIEYLSYSVNPLRIHAKGIIARPGKNQRGLHLEIPEVVVNMTLLGPFGRRSLSVENLTIRDFSAHISSKTALDSREEKPSYLTLAMKQMVAFFLFRDFNVQRAEVSNGEISLESGDQKIYVSEIYAKLTPDHVFDISCSTRAEWPQKSMHVSASRVRMTINNVLSLVDPRIEGLLRVQEASFQSPEASVGSIVGQATVAYDHKKNLVTLDPVGCHFERITLNQEIGRKPISSDLRFMAKVRLSLKENRISVSQFDLTAKDLLKLKGKLKIGFGVQHEIKLECLDAHLMTQQLLSFFPPVMKDKLAPFKLSGPVTFRGDIDGMKEKLGWHWRGNLEARLIRNRFSYTNGQVQFKSTITGEMKAEGRFPDASISCRLDADEATLLGKGMTLKPFKAALALSGKYPFFVIQEIAVQIPRATFAMEKKEVRINDIKVDLRKGQIDVEKRRLVLPTGEIDSSLLKNLRFSVSRDRNQTVIRLQGKDIHLIKSAVALDFLSADWEFDSIDSVEVTATLGRSQHCTVTSKLALSELSFHDLDETLFGEKVLISAETTADIYMKSLHMAADTRLVIDKGEVLYDKFYVDFSKNSAWASFMGRYDLREKLLQLSSLRLGLKDILDVHAYGTILHKDEHPGFDLSVNVEKTRLSPIVHHFIFEPFRTENPSLSSMHVGGFVSADLRLTGRRPDWVARGKLVWQDGQLSWDDHSILLEGIDLDLPVWYQAEGVMNDNGMAAGELSIQSMAVPLLPKQSIEVSINAEPNSLSVRSPTRLRIPGGDVEVGPLLCRMMSDFRPSVETSLTLRGVEVDPLLSAIWSQPLHGTIEGKLDPMRLEAGKLTCDGEIIASVFNGEIVFSDLGASGLFTPGPLFELSAQCRHLNLAEMTTGTAFGRVEGILRGDIKGLEIAYGQPQQFDLSFETVREKGIRQQISVKAVENISHLGGGQSPFIGLAGTFASMFKNFPYGKIGVRASLENDVFRVNGTIKEGGREYLVKRGGISGINVINQKPDNRVGFRDMIKRIKRITATKSGPVVK